MSDLQKLIEQAFEDRMNITPATVSNDVKKATLFSLLICFWNP